MSDLDPDSGPRKFKLKIHKGSKGAETPQERKKLPSGTSHPRLPSANPHDKQRLHDTLATPGSAVKNKAPTAKEQQSRQKQVLTKRKHEDFVRFFPATTEGGKLAKSRRLGRPNTRVVSEQPYRSPFKRSVGQRKMDDPTEHAVEGCSKQTLEEA
jgi:hypothetical protein